MATSVTQSLFGMTPQAIQAQRAAELNQQAMQFAQLSPMQQAQMGMFRAGSQLGTGVAGAMGYEDPEIAQAREVQGMLSGANMNDPDSLMQVAQRIQSVNPAAAQELAQRAMEMRKVQVDIQGKEAKLLQEQQGYQMRYSAVKSRYPEISDEEARGLADDPQTFREVMKETTQVVETADGMKLIDRRTGKEIANVGRAPDRRSITSVDARTTNIAENEFAKVAGKDNAERLINKLNKAEAAAPNLDKMRETRQLIETGNLRTGIAAEALLVLDRAKAKFLSDPRAKERVADTEYLDALLGSDVFPQISALGIGARGLDTPAEREFLRQVITGSISLDRETLKRMTDFRINAAEKAVEDYNKALERGEFNQYQKVTGRTLEPIQTPSRVSAGASGGTAGQTSSGTTYRVIRN
jgi:hypothetical protein